MGFEVIREIVAGNVLIAEAIQSQNFVTGVSGWQIRADGSFEFGSGGTIRGNLHVAGTNGSAVDIQTNGPQAEIDLTPPTYTGTGIVNQPATIGAGSNGTGDLSFGSLDLRSPAPAHPPLFSDDSLISLQSSTIDGSVGSAIIVDASDIQLGTSSVENTRVSGRLSNRSDGMTYLRGQYSTQTIAIPNGVNNVTAAVAFPIAFATAPNVQITIQDSGGVLRTWVVRPISVTTAGFTAWVISPTSTNTGAVGSLTVSWLATTV